MVQRLTASFLPCSSLLPSPSLSVPPSAPCIFEDRATLSDVGRGEASRRRRGMGQDRGAQGGVGEGRGQDPPPVAVVGVGGRREACQGPPTGEEGGGGGGGGEGEEGSALARE